MPGRLSGGLYAWACTYRAFLVPRRKSVAHSLNCDTARRKRDPPTNDRHEPWALTAQLNAMMKAGAAESAPLLQKLDETNETPKPGAIAAAARHKLPTGEVIMRGPSGALEPGKTTAIMGASGAGKTTIMNLVRIGVRSTRQVI